MTKYNLTENSKELDKLQQNDTVIFGKYYFNDSNTTEPMEWIVLRNDHGRILLLSRYAIDGQYINDRGFSSSSGSLTWEKCSLRKWCNEDFLNKAFTTGEQHLISLSKIKNFKKDLSRYRNTLGDSTPDTDENITEDRVFLLSSDELDIYLPNREDRLCQVTPNSRRIISTDSKNNCEWWLRTCSSMGGISDYATSVKKNGDTYDKNSLSTRLAVRPALWISAGATSNAAPAPGPAVATAQIRREPEKTPLKAPEKPTVKTPVQEKLSVQEHTKIKEKPSVSFSQEKPAEKNYAEKNTANTSGIGRKSDVSMEHTGAGEKLRDSNKHQESKHPNFDSLSSGSRTQKPDTAEAPQKSPTAAPMAPVSRAEEKPLNNLSSTPSQKNTAADKSPVAGNNRASGATGMISGTEAAVSAGSGMIIINNDDTKSPDNPVKQPAKPAPSVNSDKVAAGVHNAVAGNTAGQKVADSKNNFFHLKKKKHYVYNPDISSNSGFSSESTSGFSQGAGTDGSFSDTTGFTAGSSATDNSSFTNYGYSSDSFSSATGSYSASGSDYEFDNYPPYRSYTRYCSFSEAVKYGNLYCFSMNKKASRSEYCWFILYFFIVLVVATILFEHKADDLLNFIYLILMYQGFAITVRRFYDITGVMFVSVILAIMGPMLPVLPLLAMVIPSRTK